MHQENTLQSISEAAYRLGVSEALIEKFIKKGLLTPIQDETTLKLTAYGFRRLARILDLYEHSYPFDRIEYMLNN